MTHFDKNELEAIRTALFAASLAAADAVGEAYANNAHPEEIARLSMRRDFLSGLTNKADRMSRPLGV